MQPFLAPLLLLAVAAGSTMSVAAFATFRGTDPLSANPSAFQVVSSTPQQVQLDPAGQALRLSATNRETGQRIEERFSLDRVAVGTSGLKGIKPAEGESLFLYQISPDDLNRYSRVQEQVNMWHPVRVSTRQIVSMSVVPSGCIVADTAAEDRLTTFWLSVDDGDSFAPMDRRIDPVQLAANAGEAETVQTC